MARDYKIDYEIYNSLYNNNDICAILNTAEKFLENPIFILDTSYHILGRSKLSSTISSDVEKHNKEYYLSTDIINNIKNDKSMHTIYNSNEPFFHSADNNFIFCGIKLNNVTIAYVSVVEICKKFTNDDLEITKTLSKALSIQIEKDETFINNSGLDEEYYLKNLLTTDWDNISYIKQRFKGLNFQLKPNFFVLSIPFSAIFNDSKHNFAIKEIVKTCKNIFTNCLASYYEDSIVLLVSKNEDTLFSKEIKAEFLEFLKLNNLFCGISLSFNDLTKIRHFYSQSLYALKFSKNFKENGHIFNFEDYLEFCLFDNVSSIDLKFLVHPCIYKLNNELFLTLKAYLEHNRNANEASKALKIHRSTFFYRFHKIEEILQTPLTDNAFLFKLELSLKILKYLKSPLVYL